MATPLKSCQSDAIVLGMYSRIYHGKESCSTCRKPVGRDNLKTCGKCRLVRYCSKECQKVAWPMHKKRCAASDIDDQPGSLYAEITHWKNVWNGALRFVCLWAFDLVNHPPDRLATHCILIEIEPRENPPSRDRSFTLMSATVLPRTRFLELCEENNAPQKLVESFNSKADEHDDIIQRQTATVILKCQGFFRIIWFGYDHLELKSMRSRKPETAELMADYWDDGLKEAIEAGDPAGIQRRCIEVIGRYNTVIQDQPLPPIHPPI